MLFHVFFCKVDRFFILRFILSFWRVICGSSSFLHRKFDLASFLLILLYSSSSFHRGFEMYEFLRVFDVIWL